MSILQVIVLAFVQGVTEFLPVSSSAHLILIPWLFGWDDQGLTFDVALHAGTLLAVLIYFGREWWRIISGYVKGVLNRSAPQNAEGRLMPILVVATIPAAVAGVLLEDYAESAFRNPLLVAGQLILVSFVIWGADHRAKNGRPVTEPRWLDGIWVGFSQALAIIPGTSRAGITISAGLFRGFSREAAARFSFLLATPIIAGATVKKAYEVWRDGFPGGDTATDYLLGAGVAFLVGYAVIALFLRYLRTRTLKIFVAYRMVIGVIIVAVDLIRGSG